jgi:hypothetical protein
MRASLLMPSPRAAVLRSGTGSGSQTITAGSFIEVLGRWGDCTHGKGRHHCATAAEKRSILRAATAAPVACPARVPAIGELKKASANAVAARRVAWPPPPSCLSRARLLRGYERRPAVTPDSIDLDAARDNFITGLRRSWMTGTPTGKAEVSGLARPRSRKRPAC